jgi:hypothetical protein
VRSLSVLDILRCLTFGKQPSLSVLDILLFAFFRFDCGPSIILVPSAYEEAFDAMGVRLHEVCDLVKVDPTYTVRPKTPVPQTRNPLGIVFFRYEIVEAVPRPKISVQHLNEK